MLSLSIVELHHEFLEMFQTFFQKEIVWEKYYLMSTLT